AGGLVPEAVEDGRGAGALGGQAGRLTVAMGGKQEDMFGEACSGGEQRIELAGLLKFIESAEGGEDALANAAVGAEVFDDLQIVSWSGVFDAEEHGGLEESGHHNDSHIDIENKRNQDTMWHKRGTTFSAASELNPRKTRGFCKIGLGNRGPTVENEFECHDLTLARTTTTRNRETSSYDQGAGKCKQAQ